MNANGDAKSRAQRHKLVAQNKALTLGEVKTITHSLQVGNLKISAQNFCANLAHAHLNDRRSRRVFFCFYSAIFQLTSAKFQTFAYNSRMVKSSYMKFRQQFEINELYVCTKFRGNRSRDFGFRTGNPPRKLGVKSGLSQKRLEVRQKIFHMVVCMGGHKSVNR